MPEKSYLFSRDEFAMLLSKFGINKFYGFDVSSVEETPKKYIVFMNRLVRNGFLNVGKESLVFCDELREMLRCIADCSGVLNFYPTLSYDGTKCCYISGNKVVLSQISNESDDKIRLFIADREDLYEMLGDDTISILSDDEDEDSELDYESKKIVEFAMKNFPESDASVLKAFDHVEWVADFVDKDSGEIRKRIFVLNGERCSYIISIDKDNVDINIYTRERARDVLTSTKI